MKIKDFQAISAIPTGATYILDIAKYFGLDVNKPVDDISDEIELLTIIKNRPLEKYISINGKRYMYEKNLKEASFGAFITLENILSENDNVKNMHRLIGLFCRPAKRKWFKWYLTPYNDETYEKNCEAILEMDIDDAQSLILFFYHFVEHYSTNMKIFYLNQKKKV